MRLADQLAIDAAMRVHERAHRIQNNYANFSHCVFASRADHTAVANTASEASLLAGTNNQPKFDAGYFDQSNGGFGKSVLIRAAGVFSNTGTPTLTFKVYFNPTIGSASLAGTTVALSAAITTGSGVTTVQWDMDLWVNCNTPGQDTGNTTISAYGKIQSAGGFASPFIYAMTPGGGQSGTWTSTLASNLTQYVNISATWSAMSASNTITLKSLNVIGWN